MDVFRTIWFVCNLHHTSSIILRGLWHPKYSDSFLKVVPKDSYEAQTPKINTSIRNNFDGPELDELYIRFETCGALIQHDFIETRLDCWGQKELFCRWVLAMTCHPTVSDDNEQMLTLYSVQSSQTSCFLSFSWRLEIFSSVRLAKQEFLTTQHSWWYKSLPLFFKPA